MPDIHVVREHALGLAKARKLAHHWAEVAGPKLELECTYEEGQDQDVVKFKRSGAEGELQVTRDAFVLDARLGLVLGVFRSKIEAEIVKNLDELLGQQEPVEASKARVVAHEARPPARHARPRDAAAKPVAKAASRKPVANTAAKQPSRRG